MGGPNPYRASPRLYSPQEVRTRGENSVLTTGLPPFGCHGSHTQGATLDDLGAIPKGTNPWVYTPRNHTLLGGGDTLARRLAGG